MATAVLRTNEPTIASRAKASALGQAHGLMHVLVEAAHTAFDGVNATLVGPAAGVDPMGQCRRCCRGATQRRVLNHLDPRLDGPRNTPPTVLL